MYRSVILGAGPRAKRHAEAYAHVKSITLEAVADLDDARRTAYAEKFKVPRNYSDYKLMLRELKPDILHLVTQPNFRVDPIRTAAELGVKAVIVEKPMAADLTAANEIEKIVQQTGLKVVVNTQRRYYKTWRDACAIAHSPDAGRINFIRIITGPAISCIGSHVLDMIQYLLHDIEPRSVWATASGRADYYSNHPGPTHILASLRYPKHLQLLLEMSRDGVGVIGDAGFWSQIGINIWTTKGRIWWTEYQGWGYHLEGMTAAKTFETNFGKDDAAGQGAFTEAVATWLRDPNQPHGNRLETAIRVYRIVAALIQSAHGLGRIPYETGALRDDMLALKSKIEAVEGSTPTKENWGAMPPEME